jgi:DNA-binding CsgD family transcriptional regulator
LQYLTVPVMREMISGKVIASVRGHGGSGVLAQRPISPEIRRISPLTATRSDATFSGKHADANAGGDMGNTWDERFREKLSAQTSLNSAALLLAECADELGWNLAAFQLDREQLALPRCSDGQFIGTAMGWPADCVNEWVDRELGKFCPVTQLCGRTAESIVWECDPAGVEWRGRKLAPEQCDVLDYYCNYFEGAVTVPVHRPGGKSGYVTWCIGDRGNLLQRAHETYSATYLISHAFIRHIDRLEVLRREAFNTANPDALTAREIECLSWAACGKTEEEIALIIQRSHETARFHLRNAVTKLNASNRTHAVAIACSRGLITVR